MSLFKPYIPTGQTLIRSLYWAPFCIIALSFHIYFLEFISSEGIIFHITSGQKPSYIYFRYFMYFFLLSALAATAFSKTIKIKKAYSIAFSIAVVSAPLLVFRQAVIAPVSAQETVKIFFEVALIICGLLIVGWAGRINKKIWLIPNNDKDKTAFLIIASLIFLWAFYLDHIPIAGDGLMLFPPAVSADALSLNYWLHIFTHTHHGGEQYRPLSFVVIFSLFGHIFGSVAWPFQCLGAVLVMISGMLLFYLIKEISKNYFLALIGGCCLISHYSVINMATKISHVFKYFFPLAILIGGLLAVRKGKLGKKSWPTALFLLSILGILSHEGSFVFPIVFIIYDFALYKKIRRSYMLLIAPSVIYCVFRFLIYKAPSEGFMAVDVFTVLDHLPRYLDYALIPAHFISLGDYWLYFSLLFFVALLLVSLCLIDKNRYFLLIAHFSFALIILSPFSALPNHFYWTRMIWAIPALVVLLVCIISNIRQRQIKLLFCVMFAGWLLILAHFSFLRVKYRKKSLYSKIESQESLRLSIARQIQKGVPSALFIKGLDSKKQIRFRYLKELHHLAGFLAIHFPKEVFVIMRPESHHEPSFYPHYLVQNGDYFFNKKHKWVNKYSYEKAINLPDKAIKITLEENWPKKSLN